MEKKKKTEVKENEIAQNQNESYLPEEDKAQSIDDIETPEDLEELFSEPLSALIPAPVNTTIF